MSDLAPKLHELHLWAVVCGMMWLQGLLSENMWNNVYLESYYEFYEHFAICSKNDSSTHIGLYWSFLTIKIPGRWIIFDAFAFQWLFVPYYRKILDMNWGCKEHLPFVAKNNLYLGTSTSCNIKSPDGWIIFYAIPMKSFVPFSKIVIGKQLKCKRKWPPKHTYQTIL